ncbi:MAG: ABC transporter substrate-binding protein [Bacteroidales bacterium]|jgi:iron complex transport system substrate-binding protein|nr:ABC transporter substrate-binding protein [Bacteroidales bacterium]
MKFILKILFFLLPLYLLLGCSNNNSTNIEGEIIQNKYSTGFEIIKDKNGFILNIKDRFSKSGINVDTYYLRTDNSGNSNKSTIQIPIQKAICLSTTHCAFISAIGETETIKGISGIDYIYNTKILELIEQGEITEIGYDKQINYEKIISLNPDVVFAFGVDNNSMSSYQKLNNIGIPVIYVGDFLESKPLGRTEWIKFFGCFYDKLDYTVEYFDSIEKCYNSLLNKKNINISEKPEILVGLPWKGTWWVPGGDSFFSNYINDAGGNYIYGNNNKSESIPYTIEEIFLTAQNADIWLHPNAAADKNQILMTDERLKNFSPYDKSRIYNNNKRTSDLGGNDFWESGIIHPDIILRDLQLIFYSNQNSNDSLYYYKELY